jgi:hypothetical protein
MCPLKQVTTSDASTTTMHGESLQSSELDTSHHHTMLGFVLLNWSLLGFHNELMKILAVVTTLALATFASPASAQENSPEFYNLTTNILLVKCRAVMSVALNRMAQGDSPEEARNNGDGSDGDGDWLACIVNAKKQGAALYSSTITPFKKSGAIKALKSYQAAWLAAMDSIPPAGSEIRLDYRRRQSDMDTKLREAWSRVQVEL